MAIKKRINVFLAFFIIALSLFATSAMAGKINKKFRGDIFLINETPYSIKLISSKNKEKAGCFIKNRIFIKQKLTVISGNGIRVGHDIGRANPVEGAITFEAVDMPESEFTIDYHFSSEKEDQKFSIREDDNKETLFALSVEKKKTSQDKKQEYLFILVLKPKENFSQLVEADGRKPVRR